VLLGGGCWGLDDRSNETMGRGMRLCGVLKSRTSLGTGFRILEGAYGVFFFDSDAAWR